MTTYTQVQHDDDHDHLQQQQQQQQQQHGTTTCHLEEKPTHVQSCSQDQVLLVYDNDNLRSGHENCVPTALIIGSDSDTTTTPVQSSQPRITWFDACMHLIKGNLGPGCLNLPHAFAESGWLLGTVLLLLVAVQGIYSMILLAECKDLLFHANTHRPVLTFMDVAQVSLGPVGRAVVQVFLFVLQSGVCCVFLSLISTNLRAQTSLSSTESIVLVTAALLVVSMFRHLKNLRCLSTTANIFMLTAILTAAIAAGYSISHNDLPLPAQSTSDWGIVATFISSMFFSFEGIGLVLPVENAYTISPSPELVGHANRFFRHWILPSAMSMVGILFWMTGFMASWGFPAIHSGSITAYLALEFPNQPWFAMVNTLVMMAVFLTFPLQLTPAIQVLEDLMESAPAGPTATATAHDDDDDDENVLSLDEWDGSEQSTSSSNEAPVPVNDDRVSPEREGDLRVEINNNYHNDNESVTKTFWQRYHWIILRHIIVLGCSMVVLMVDDLALLMALFGAVGQTGLAMMPCWCHVALQHRGLAPHHRGKTIMDIMTILFSTAVMIFGVYVSITRMIYR